MFEEKWWKNEDQTVILDGIIKERSMRPGRSEGNRPVDNLEEEAG